MILIKYSNESCYLEAYGFKSLPFDIKDLNKNKELFDILINHPVVGTIQ